MIVAIQFSMLMNNRQVRHFCACIKGAITFKVYLWKPTHVLCWRVNNFAVQYLLDNYILYIFINCSGFFSVMHATSAKQLVCRIHRDLAPQYYPFKLNFIILLLSITVTILSLMSLTWNTWILTAFSSFSENLLGNSNYNLD